MSFEQRHRLRVPLSHSLLFSLSLSRARSLSFTLLLSVSSRPSASIYHEYFIPRSPNSTEGESGALDGWMVVVKPQDSPLELQKDFSECVCVCVCVCLCVSVCVCEIGRAHV